MLESIMRSLQNKIVIMLNKIIIIAILIFPTSGYAIQSKIYIGKAITYLDSYNNPINKNEHLGKLTDYFKSTLLGATLFKDQTFLSCSTNRLLNQPIKIGYYGAIIKRKALSDTCSLGYSTPLLSTNISTSIILSNINIYDRFNGITTRKTALLKGLGIGAFKNKYYFGFYWFDRNRELSIRNAFGIAYQYYF